MVLVDLAPDLALPVPRRGRLAGGNLSDVDGHGPRVGDRRLGVIVERLSRGHIEDPRSASAGVTLITPDGVGVDAWDWSVALEVGGRSDVLPVG